jgi:D-alanyl-D-alanine carboxypeptidase
MELHHQTTPPNAVVAVIVASVLTSFDSAQSRNENPPSQDTASVPRAPVKPRPEQQPGKAGAPEARQQATLYDGAANSDWSIRVGAFATEKDARDKLRSVAKAVQSLNRAGQSTEAVTRGDSTLYRARFAGLHKDEAEAACRQLKRDEVDCIVSRNEKALQPKR